MDRLKSVGIVTRTTAGPYRTNMFHLLDNAQTKLRLIFDFSPLTPHLQAPHFHLPSIYQILEKQHWPPNLKYVKLDFSQAFCNLDIHPNSKYVTTTKVGNIYYCFNYLPFGLSIAPFVCQQLLNRITIEIRKHTKHVWGHIDDVKIAHKDPKHLRCIVTMLLAKLTKAGWVINPKKTILEPQSTINFLGAIWGQTEVKRDPKLKKALRAVISSIHADNTKKQKIRSYLNYYLAFAGKVHSLVNRVLNSNEGKVFLFALMEEDKIKFRDPDYTKEVNVFTDATKTRIGWHSKFFRRTMRTWPLPIIVTETLTALAGIEHDMVRLNISRIRLFTDNMATAFFLKRGTSGFLYSLTLEEHYTFLIAISSIHRCVHLRTDYIKSSENPADALTRL